MSNLIGELIVRTAEQYLGQREKPGNMGFIDPAFDKKMRARGFRNGWAWCCLANELVYVEAYEEYKPGLVPLLNKLFSPHCMTTYNNFKKDGTFKVGTVPVVGAMAFYESVKNGKPLPGNPGHTCIVTAAVTNGHIKTIDGNSNDEGSREGYEMCRRERGIKTKVADGLRFVGFVYPV